MLDEAVTAPYIFEGVKESPRRLAYRNKMEFSFGDEQKDGPLALGMHKRGSFYDIVNVNQCRIVDEDYRRILTCVSEYFQEQALPFYHKLRHTGYLRHLLVRKGAKTGEILVDLVTTTQLEAADQPWVERLLALELEGTIVSILHTYNDSLADVVQSDRTELLYGRDYFCEELLGLRFKISPFSFFQTNSLGAEVLYETARSYIGDTKDKVVFDLYSGTGTIAQMLAPVARKVVGVEIVEEAVEAARVNAGLNGLSNCTFIAGDVLKVIDDLTEKPDLIVLDPPRDGIHPKALQKIIDFGVERIVYISCKPTSLMRDLELLQGRGYKVEKAVGVDMFPGTGHVECVIMMQYCGKEKKK
jgi:23S rRNA (uracil-5-)-methyltransferase RumA